jgi:hypothetical protein
MRAQALAMFVSCTCGLAACSGSDVGQPCPELLGTTDPATIGDGRTETAEVVAYDPLFRCDSLICVASAGRSGYCSRACRTNGACPGGFECRVIQPVGSFANEMFCAWKQCDKTADCGSKKEFCCRPVIGSDPVQPKKYCDFARGDTCE